MPVPAGLRRCHYMLLIWLGIYHILGHRNRHEQEMSQYERSFEIGWCSFHFLDDTIKTKIQLKQNNNQDRSTIKTEVQLKPQIVLEYSTLHLLGGLGLNRLCRSSWSAAGR